MMIVLQKIFYYKETEHELKSFYQKTNKFCMDAKFLNVVEIEQYFMRKDTAEFSQFTDAVVCREYTLCKRQASQKPIVAVWTITKISLTSLKSVYFNTDDDLINDTKKTDKQNNKFHVDANLKHNEYTNCKTRKCPLFGSVSSVSSSFDSLHIFTVT